MDFNYISTKEAAKLLGVTERYIQMLCKEGKIEGAVKFNDQGVWLVPQEAILTLSEKSKER
jgi:excisionase family DNA binding protein